MSSLLSRYAECIFWLARFVERAEDLARILDVNETFSRDARGSQNWLSIVQLNADEKRFFEKHPIATADAVIRFYVTDVENPTSIIAAIRAARENARTLRPLISTEMWVHLNVFYNRLKAIDKVDLAPGTLTRSLAWIKESCQTHTGITEGTFFRDQGWYFYQLGRYIERADQTTRLLDIKYHLLLPKTADVGSPVDASQWSALLRSAAGYHAFRRLHSNGITPARVAGFLLLNHRFPRSVYLCLREIDNYLNELRSRYSLRGGSDACNAVDELHAVLSTKTIDEILGAGLHEFIDLIQCQLSDITNRLAVAFFGVLPTVPDVEAVPPPQ
ncbi:MAG TPA: alpha-E domain-containing protein [Aliidongia sp.]|uniref:alpha-E domain-containing protein n=1 Tax=Aliidongia sp. TaxID=1914230 RepID=UPI002DDCD5CB|nr:alpha-E domain-containing protein [Aliidongia sp.]HEV2678050.1 alpha-E domain-containing protein [Aliidongia sp.]